MDKKFIPNNDYRDGYNDAMYKVRKAMITELYSLIRDTSYSNQEIKEMMSLYSRIDEIAKRVGKE